MELGPVWRVPPPDQSDPDQRPDRLTPRRAKPERRVRPDGSRAHFLAVPLFLNPVLAFAPLKFFPGVSPAQDLAVNAIQDGTRRSPRPADHCPPDQPAARAPAGPPTGQVGGPAGS